MIGEPNLKDGSEFPRFNVRLLKKFTEKYIVEPVEKGDMRHIEGYSCG